MKISLRLSTALTLIASGCLLLLAGCSGGPELSVGKSIGQVYRSSSAPVIRFADSPSALAQPKAVPILRAPQVFAIYVPSHLDRDRDMLVGEHWLYVKLRQADWFVKENPRKAVTVGGPAGMNDIEALKPVMKEMNKILIPYRQDPRAKSPVKKRGFDAIK